MAARTRTFISGWLVLLTLLAGTGKALAWSPISNPMQANQLAALMSFATQQTGLKFSQPIRVDWVDQATLNHETARLFDETYTQQQVAAEDHLLRAFRIIYYHQMDLRSVVIAERAMWLGPLFDSKNNRLIVVKPVVPGKIPALEQMDILREATIGLLQQHYPSVPYDQFGLNSSDQVQAARLTWGSQVIAVQATYLKLKGDAFQQEFLSEQQDRGVEAAIADKGTDFLIERLIMPFEGQIGYDYWQHAAKNWGANGIKALAAHPSQTTGEYLAQQRPALLAATYQSAEPNLSGLLSGWQPLMDGQAWGEWQSVLMVNSHLPMGAPEFTGNLESDSIQLWGKGQDTVMVWRTIWDNLGSFRQFQNSWWSLICFPPQLQDQVTTYAEADWETLIARSDGNSVTVILAPTKSLAEAILDKVAPK